MDSVCKYCGTTYEFQQKNFQSACGECTQKMVDVQLPYIRKMDQGRNLIKNIQQKIDTLYELQHKALDEMAAALYAQNE